MILESRAMGILGISPVPTVIGVMQKRLGASDARLFRESVEDAEPLETNQAEPFRHHPPPVPLVQPPELNEGFERTVPVAARNETGDYLFFSRGGVQKRLLADLRRGHLEIGLVLDLHGLTVAYAERVLDEFLHDCARRGVRCALVIHGKGGHAENRPPVLKCKLNDWLRRYGEVLAFCSATRRHGGTGALYLLLRNPAKSRRERKGR